MADLNLDFVGPGARLALRAAARAEAAAGGVVGDLAPLVTAAQTAATTATTAAGTAATQAGVATTQAGIATTQAALAASNGFSGGAKFIYDENNKPSNLAVKISAPGQLVLYTTGAYSTNAAYDTVSGPVRGGSTIRTNRTVTGSVTGIVFRTLAGAFISGIQTPAAYTDIAVPASAASFEISYPKGGAFAETGRSSPTDVRKGLFIWDTFAGTPADISLPGFSDPRSVAQIASKSAREMFTGSRRDYFDPEAVTAESIINRNLTVSAFAGWFLTGLIPVRFGVPIYLSRPCAPGSSTDFAPVWHDETGAPFSHSSTRLTANIVNGSNQITVTAIDTANGYGSPVRGMNLVGTGSAASAFPAGTYVVDGPADRGLGTYTLSNNATGDFTGAAIDSRGVPAGVPLYPIKGAAYVRIPFENKHLYALRIVDAALAASGQDARAANGDYDRKQLYALRNKVGALVGTSIFFTVVDPQNHYFAYSVEKRTESYLAQISPLPGRQTRAFFDATAATSYPAVRGSTADLVAGDFAAIDYLMADPGTNDWANNRPLGALGDTAASGTFYGDLYDIFIAKAQTWKPALRIFLTTPLPRFATTTDAEATEGNGLNSIGVRLSAYADAVKAFCQRYKLTCIDLFYGGIGVNSISKSVFMTDGIHPSNQAAYDRLMLAQITGVMNRTGA